MSWRARVDEALAGGDKRDTRDISNGLGAFVPSVPSVLGAPPLDQARTLKLCRAGLGRLDPARPLHQLDGGRWRRLLEDAEWVLDEFAPGAFADGWTAVDLFGLWWWDNAGTLTLKDGWGGIADRLQGARSLKMTANRAHWRMAFSGEPMAFLRTAYPNLKPLWKELDQ